MRSNPVLIVFKYRTSLELLYTSASMFSLQCMKQNDVNYARINHLYLKNSIHIPLMNFIKIVPSLSGNNYIVSSFSPGVYIKK